MNFVKLHFILLFIFLLSSETLLAQNTGISDEVRTPAPSAVLDVYSTSKGMLVPGVVEAQRIAISNPETGLLVY